MNLGSSAASAASSAYGTYYDPFYPNGSHASWTSAYGANPPSASAGACGLLTTGHKGLTSSHYTPVHQQRRKRRVLFTQAQVSWHPLSLLE